MLLSRLHSRSHEGHLGCSYPDCLEKPHISQLKTIPGLEFWDLEQVLGWSHTEKGLVTAKILHTPPA